MCGSRSSILKDRSESREQQAANSAQVLEPTSSRVMSGDARGRGDAERALEDAELVGAAGGAAAVAAIAAAAPRSAAATAAGASRTAAAAAAAAPLASAARRPGRSGSHLGAGVGGLHLGHGCLRAALHRVAARRRPRLRVWPRREVEEGREAETGGLILVHGRNLQLVRGTNS